MKFTKALVAVQTIALPAVLGYKLPTCGAENCLEAGLFYGCEPSDLVCLCSKEQALVTEYIEDVKPCLDSPDRSKYCTDGALDQYKDLLGDVCKQFDKTVQF